MKEEVDFPQVSVIMATYNRSHLIEETLNSLRKQSFEAWECLIIDDGSTDSTSEIVKKNIQEDRRFRYFKRGEEYSKGLPGSRNKGIDLAKGRYIMFVDDDDILHPANLQVSVRTLEKNESSFCRFDKKPFNGNWKENNLNRVDEFGEKQFCLNDLEKMITGKIPFASCTVLWNSQCFKDIRFNENLMYAEEWECYTRILSEGFEGVSIDLVLYYNRKHSNSNTAEFIKNDPVRIRSKIEATKLIVLTLAAKNLLTPHLKKFFLRIGYSLKSLEIIQLTLNKYGAPKLEVMKYRLGFHFYPLLRPLFILKSKL